MAVEAIDALGRMDAHLVLVHDGSGLLSMTLGTLARCPHERSTGLPRKKRTASGSVSETWPSAIDHKGRDNQRGTNHNRNEDRFERHNFLLH